LGIIDVKAIRVEAAPQSVTKVPLEIEIENHSDLETDILIEVRFYRGAEHINISGKSRKIFVEPLRLEVR